MNYFLELMVKYFRLKVNMAADKCVTTSLEDGRGDLVGDLIVTLSATLSSVPSNWQPGIMISSVAFSFLCVVSVHKGIT